MWCCDERGGRQHQQLPPATVSRPAEHQPDDDRRAYRARRLEQRRRVMRHAYHDKVRRRGWHHAIADAAFGKVCRIGRQPRQP